MKKNTVAEMLEQRVWAVMGVSRDKNKFGYKIYRKLLDKGYSTYAVNPNMKEVDSNKCYPNLAELPEVPQVVCFVVPPEVTAEAVKDCKELGVRFLWMQPGSVDLEAVRSAEEAGISVVHDVCVLQLA